MVRRLFLIFIFLTSIQSCSKEEKLYEPTVKQDPYKLYKEALDAFDKNDFSLQVKSFLRLN